MPPKDIVDDVERPFISGCLEAAKPKEVQGVKLKLDILRIDRSLVFDQDMSVLHLAECTRQMKGRQAALHSCVHFGAGLQQFSNIDGLAVPAQGAPRDD